MINNLKDKIKNIKDKDRFIRIDANHPLDLFIGVDNNNALSFFLRSSIEPPSTSSSKTIGISITKKEDYYLSFLLLSNDLEEQFFYFVDDMVEASRDITTHNAPKFMIDRFKKWKALMASSKNGLLSAFQVRGLIGELAFIKRYMIPRYGLTQTIKAWIGSINAHQDFKINDIWFEVKSKSTSGDDVVISSIEQLDIEKDGFLVVVEMDRTSSVSNTSITLNSIIKDLISSIQNPIDLELFEQALLHIGYIDKSEYDHDYFFISEIFIYKVIEEFPRLRKARIPNGIVDANYKISVHELKRFLVEVVKWS